MNGLIWQIMWIELRGLRRHHLSYLALLILGTSMGCKPEPSAGDVGLAESTDEQEPTTSESSSDDTTTTGDGNGDGDGESDCLPDGECPCAPGDDHVVGLSTGKLGTACARFADGSLSCWGNYEAMTLHAVSDWWPYDAFDIFDSRCPTLPLGRYPRLTIPGGLVGVSTDPMQILGVDAEHRVGAVLSPSLADLGWDLVDGVVSGYAGETVESWPEGSLAPEAAFVEIATGWFADSGRACARTENGEVCCWGDPEWGTAILGLPEWPTDAYFPAQAPEGSFGSPIRQIVDNGGAVLVLLDDGRVQCWGRRAQCPLDDGVSEAIYPYTPKVAATELPPLDFHCDCADP